MNQKYDYRVIMIAKGKRINSGHQLDSCFVRAQLDSIRPHVKEVVPFAIDDTVSPWGILRNAMELRGLISSIRPDIVHAQWGSTTAVIGLLATRNKAIPLIISFCGSDLIEIEGGPIIKRLRSKLAVAIGRFCSRYAEVVIVKSANLYALLPKVVKAKAYALPNGVDMAKFRVMPKVKARRLLSWDPDLSIILFSIGGILGRETVINLKLAEAAFSILKAENNIALEKIRGVPHEMMPVYLNASDVLLVTSLHEGSPNIVKEAMACNLPVVTVKCGDVSERLENVYPSRVVTSYDPRSIAIATMEILQSKKRPNGRKELREQHLEIESVAEKLVKIYDVAVNRSSKI